MRIWIQLYSRASLCEYHMTSVFEVLSLEIWQNEAQAKATIQNMHQEVLDYTKHEEKLSTVRPITQRYFMICQTCFWCASYIGTNELPFEIYPTCCDNKFESFTDLIWWILSLWVYVNPWSCVGISEILNICLSQISNKSIINAQEKNQKYHKDFIHFSMYVTCLLSSSTQKTLITYCQSRSLKEVKDIRQLLAILRNNACSHSRTKQYECILWSERYRLY